MIKPWDCQRLAIRNVSSLMYPFLFVKIKENISFFFNFMSTVAYFSYNFYRYRYHNEWKNQTVLDIFCNQSDKNFFFKNCFFNKKTLCTIVTSILLYIFTCNNCFNYSNRKPKTLNNWLWPMTNWELINLWKPF